MQIATPYLAAGGLIALFVGLLLGWVVGRFFQTEAITRRVERNVAFLENARFDFGVLGSKADQIIRLANEITMAAKVAQKTAASVHARKPQSRGASDEPGVLFEDKSR